MAEKADKDQTPPANEVTPGGQVEPNPPEARTPKGDAHNAATTYSEQAAEHKGTQDPYPYDPTNELLDGDDSPDPEDLAARGVRVSDSGRALVPLDDPTGVMSIPPPNANLELAKSREKVAVANDEADGVDPEIGRQARREGLRQAGKARLAEAKGGGSDATPPAAARSQAPAGRTPTPPRKQQG
jgi:hypothetical protein